MTEYVATLIGTPERPLTEDAVQDAGRKLVALACGNLRPEWLSDKEACDVFFTGDALAARQALEADACDVIVQPVEGRRKLLLVADMESTLIKEEMLEELAALANIRPQVEEITRRAMNGELDFTQSLQERLLLLKGTPENAVNALVAKMTLNPGAKELVATMRANGAYCVIASGGFRLFTRAIATQLGCDEEFANELHLADGAISGQVVEPVLDKNAKLATLRRLAETRGLSLEATCAVGDGANDVPMLQAAGLGVAYHAKPAVQAVAMHKVRFADLQALLFAQGYKREEIIGA